MKKKPREIISILLAALLFLWTSVPACGADAPEPVIAAEGAVVYCGNTGETVYSKNSGKELDPSGIAILMTVLLAIQNLSMEQETVISSLAAGQKGPGMGLKEGESVRVKDLIYGALLCSGNDAAYALAEAVSGTAEGFVELMNRTAENIGCRHTHFAGPGGSAGENHYSTACEMTKIAKIALSNSMIREAAGRDTYKVKKTDKSGERTLTSPMKDIRESFPGICAGLESFEGDSGRGIAFGLEKAGLVLWVVLLNSTSAEIANDINVLLDHSEQKIEGVKVIEKGRQVGEVRVRHGVVTRIPAYTTETGYAYLPKEASASLISAEAAVRNDVEAPVKAGDEVGVYRIYVAGELVNEIKLVARENVDTGWFTSYLGISNRAAVIIGVIALLLTALVIWVRIIKAVYRRKKRRLREERIMRLAMEELKREKEHLDRDWRF